MFDTELNRLKALIEFAIEKRIPHFKYQDFEFNLTAPDPKQDSLDSLALEVDRLRAIVEKVQLNQSFKKAS